MTQSQPLTIRVPIRGKLFLRIDGTNSEHEVGSFEKTMDVSFGVAGGNVSFQFDQTFWEETIKPGVEAPTPQHPEMSTYEIVLKELQDGGVKLPEQLAGKICHALSHEGRLSA